MLVFIFQISLSVLSHKYIFLPSIDIHAVGMYINMIFSSVLGLGVLSNVSKKCVMVRTSVTHVWILARLEIRAGREPTGCVQRRGAGKASRGSQVCHPLNSVSLALVRFLQVSKYIQWSYQQLVEAAGFAGLFPLN